MYAFITVRTESSRLPRKCLLPFGQVCVLEHVIDRARMAGFDPIVCTTVMREDDVIERIAHSVDCPVVRGSNNDKLKRWLDACKAFGVDEFHQFDADDPFIDGELAHRSMVLLHSGYDIVYPSENTYIGSVGFSLTGQLIEDVCAHKSSDDTEMMWHFVEQLPDVRATTLKVSDVVCHNIRLTLDYPEDYVVLSVVRFLLGELANRRDIERLFLRNPDLSKINWFRNEEWKDAQERKR